MNRSITVAILLAGSSLAACTAFELRDANSQLTELYAAAASGDAIASSNARSGLATLAADAGAAAARASVPANQISFYRVAATAAWQARDFEGASAYADAAAELCRANAAAVPRDCAMLGIIPSLAAVDELTLRLDTRPDRSTLLDIFRLYGSRADELIAERAEIARGPVDPELVSEIDRRIGQVLCENMNQAILGGLAGDVSAQQCEIKNRLDAADRVGIDVSDPAVFERACSGLRARVC